MHKAIKNPELKSFLLSVLLLLISFINVRATTTTWSPTAATTNWSTASNWDHGVPDNTIDAVIGTSTNPPDLTATSQALSLTFTGGGTLHCFGFTITVTNSITGTGTLFDANASVVIVGGDFTPSSFSSTGGGTLKFNGTTQATSITSFDNLTIMSGTTTFNSSTTITGTLTINSGATITTAASNIIGGTIINNGTMMVTAAGNADDLTHQFTGSLTISGGTINYSGTAGQTIPAKTFGNLTISNTAPSVGLSGNINVSGILNVASGSVLYSSNHNVTVGGDFTGPGQITTQPAGSETITVGGNLTVLVNYNGETIVLNGTTQNIGANSFNNLTINSGCTATLTGSIVMHNVISVLGILDPGTNTVSGFATLSGSGTIKVKATGNTDDLTSQYSITSLSLSSTTVEFDGASIQKLGDHIFGNATINATGGVTLTGTNGLVINGALSGSSTLTATNQLFSVGGSISVPFSCGSSTVTCSGPSLGSITFNNLVVSRLSGITLSGDITVNNNLNFSSGSLTLGTHKLIIATLGTITGANSSQYVLTNSTGVLEMTTSGSTTFPIGDGFNPITIQPSVDGTYDVGVTNGLFDNAGGVQATHAVGVTWTVTPTSNSPSAYFLPQWNASDELTAFDRTQCYVIVRTTTPTGTWINNSVIGPATGIDPYTQTTWLMPLTQNTTYYVGVADNASALPVTLISFNAQYANNQVNLNWSTASEINNHYFTVERSTDGQNWNAITQVEGHGNSLITQNYFLVDNLAGIIPSGNIYYRLKQVDYNGGFEYSMIRSVTLNNSPPNVSIYPNPANNLLNVSWTSENSITILKLVNSAGSTIYSENISGLGLLHKQIDLSTVPAGTYIIQMATDKDIKSQVVTKQ